LKSKKLTSLNELKNKYKEAFQVKSTEIVTEKLNNENEEIDVNNSFSEDVLDYDYLMNMNIWSLTHEKVNELEEQIKNQTKEYELLKVSKPEDLWKKDLEEFINLYQKIINNVDEKNKEAEQKIGQNKSKAVIKGKKKRGQNKSKENTNTNNKKNSVKKKRKKNEDSFLVSDEEEDYVSESDDDSSSSSVSSENIELDPDGDYTIYPSNSKNKKQNKLDKVIDNKSKTKGTVKKDANKNKNKEDTILLDENEENEKGKTSVKKKNSKPPSTKKTNKIIVSDDEEEIEINKKNNNLSKNEKTLLKNLGVEKVKNVKDPSKLTLRERLALRVANGNIDTFLNNLDNNIQHNNTNTIKKSKKTMDISDINEIEEILDDKDDEFLKKKKKASIRKSASATKSGKNSTKKKKILEDSEDL